MKWIKLRTDTVLGKKGETVQVADHLAKTRIESGDAVEAKEPSRGKRATIENKALSAK